MCTRYAQVNVFYHYVVVLACTYTLYVGDDGLLLTECKFICITHSLLIHLPTNTVPRHNESEKILAVSHIPMLWWHNRMAIIIAVDETISNLSRQCQERNS